MNRSLKHALSTSSPPRAKNGTCITTPIFPFYLFRWLTVHVLSATLSVGCAFLAMLSRTNFYSCRWPARRLPIGSTIRSALLLHVCRYPYRCWCWIYAHHINRRASAVGRSRWTTEPQMLILQKVAPGFVTNYIIERDRTCIVSNAPPRFCEGSHYYPHAKGSEVGHFV